MHDGGYDDGYLSCPCFWGKNPGSLVRKLEEKIGNFDGLRVLDLGCGEGKNAAHFANSGASVLAFDVSGHAIANGINTWPKLHGITWKQQDIRDFHFEENRFDIIVAYGLFHCLSSEKEVSEILHGIKQATKVGGFCILCAFNDRFQDLSGHKDFYPLLLRHKTYSKYFYDWDLTYISDEDLHEIHPNNSIPHVHSMTRIIAQRLK